MRMIDILEKKKKGEALTDEEIAFFVRGYTDGTIPDYQASALTMAVCLRGMDARETATLTREMAHSGDMMDLSPLGEKTVDKHSTGGVGDKTTLIVAPLAAACGCTVAKMSGRGLGHTGGTIDKLESLPGYRTGLSIDEFFQVARQTGVCVIGQTGNLTPADKKLYALRDATATVDDLSLIASSIMSKKLAAGSSHIVLDVKVGSGAFMKTLDDARALARCMVNIGRANGRQVRALLTDMDSPLGYCVGNLMEVEEAIRFLRGEAVEPTLREVCLALATEMVSLTQVIDRAEAAQRVNEALTSGRALDIFRAWVTAQGAEDTYLRDPDTIPRAPVFCDFSAPADGVYIKCDAEGVGHAASLLGAGRKTKEDPIDPLAGIRFFVRLGDRVKAGQCLARLYASDATLLPSALSALGKAVTLSHEESRIATPASAVLDIVS